MRHVAAGGRVGIRVRRLLNPAGRDGVGGRNGGVLIPNIANGRVNPNVGTFVPGSAGSVGSTATTTCPSGMSQSFQRNINPGTEFIYPRGGFR